MNEWMPRMMTEEVDGKVDGTNYGSISRTRNPILNWIKNTYTIFFCFYSTFHFLSFFVTNISFCYCATSLIFLFNFEKKTFLCPPVTSLTFEHDRTELFWYLTIIHFHCTGLPWGTDLYTACEKNYPDPDPT